MSSRKLATLCRVSPELFLCLVLSKSFLHALHVQLTVEQATTRLNVGNWQVCPEQRVLQLEISLRGSHTLSCNHAHHSTVSAGRVDDDWQLVSAASGSSIPSTSSHQAGSRPTQQHGPHHQQTSVSNCVSQHQSPVKGSCDVQSFPDLDRLSNEELAALLVDDTKYGNLIDSIMARSSVAQVCSFPFLLLLMFDIWHRCS